MLKRLPFRSSTGASPALVTLDPDHPGFFDAGYRARRNEIARLAVEYRSGQAVPHIEYTEEEHAVWSRVWGQLEPLHARLACREVLEAQQQVPLDRDRVPQLRDVNALLKGRSGFQMLPVAGLVQGSSFLAHLGEDVFLSTQYIRHPSRPLYTPEPDILHELVGHAATLAHEGFCRLNRAFGRTAQRVHDARRARLLEQLYWFTLEFGVVREAGELKACGAGLLSSYGELGRLPQHADLRGFDPEVAAATTYDPTTYQSVLYVASSFERMVEDTEVWLRSL